MTRIKLCGLMRIRDIETANDIRPDYIGFVFDRKSRRYVTPQQAALLRMHLTEGIWTVGVFVNEAPEYVAQLLNSGIIDIAQLHGTEDEAYILHMRAMTLAPVIQAFFPSSENGFVVIDDKFKEFRSSEVQEFRQ